MTSWTGAQWHAVGAELGAEHQQTAAVKALGDSEGRFCALKEGVSAVIVKKASSCVTHHRRKPCARLDQRVDVVILPVPDLDLKSGLRDPPYTLFNGEVEEHHLRADS